MATRLVCEKEKHTIISYMSWYRLNTDVHKIFKCKLSFKCRCQRALWLLIENFEHRCDQVILGWYFQEKKNITATEVVLTPLLSYNVVSKHKDKNENIEYHGMFISFKTHLYSKQGSPIFLLFGSWSLALYLLVWAK